MIRPLVMPDPRFSRPQQGKQTNRHRRENLSLSLEGATHARATPSRARASGQLIPPPSPLNSTTTNIKKVKTTPSDNPAAAAAATVVHEALFLRFAERLFEDFIFYFSHLSESGISFSFLGFLQSAEKKQFEEAQKAKSFSTFSSSSLRFTFIFILFFQVIRAYPCTSLDVIEHSLITMCDT
ncbi:hypothetical protein EPI10_015071 [Gossypium australe]|uniref:Uncharacterized protein n=1 Tax=Gossypium australe TaxID=47621 RepID=A0A5B6VJN7_9ROSI|nr:hypothetical protein EPI10_015071 [Gossypium australe]